MLDDPRLTLQRQLAELKAAREENADIETIRTLLGSITFIEKHLGVPPTERTR